MNDKEEEKKLVKKPTEPRYLGNELGMGMPNIEPNTPPPRRGVSPEGYAFCNETGLGLEDL